MLLRNLLISREPIYGVGEWAARYAPDLLGLTDAESALNDDRVGRALDRLFAADVPALVLSRGPRRARVRRPPRRVAQRLHHGHLPRRLRGAERGRDSCGAGPPWPSPAATTRTTAPT